MTICISGLPFADTSSAVAQWTTWNIDQYRPSLMFTALCNDRSNHLAISSRMYVNRVSITPTILFVGIGHECIFRAFTRRMGYGVSMPRRCVDWSQISDVTGNNKCCLRKTYFHFFRYSDRAQKLYSIVARWFAAYRYLDASSYFAANRKKRLSMDGD